MKIPIFKYAQFDMYVMFVKTTLDTSVGYALCLPILYVSDDVHTIISKMAYTTLITDNFNFKYSKGHK